MDASLRALPETIRPQPVSRAMSFSVAALRANAPIRIHDSVHVATSFPNFLALCKQVGMRVEPEAQV